MLANHKTDERGKQCFCYLANWQACRQTGHATLYYESLWGKIKFCSYFTAFWSQSALAAACSNIKIVLFRDSRALHIVQLNNNSRIGRRLLLSGPYVCTSCFVTFACLTLTFVFTCSACLAELSGAEFNNISLILILCR